MKEDRELFDLKFGVEDKLYFELKQRLGFGSD